MSIPLLVSSKGNINSDYKAHLSLGPYATAVCWYKPVASAMVLSLFLIFIILSRYCLFLFYLETDYICILNIFLCVSSRQGGGQLHSGLNAACSDHCAPVLSVLVSFSQLKRCRFFTAK